MNNNNYERREGGLEISYPQRLNMTMNRQYSLNSCFLFSKLTVKISG